MTLGNVRALGSAVTPQRDTQTRPEIVREARDCDLSHKG